MRTIALETTEKTASLAALDKDHVLDSIQLPTHQRTAQSLILGLKELLQRNDWKPADIQLVAVSIGPGSFTGLRLGVTTAKTLAYSVGAQLVGIGTLDVVAYQAPDPIQQLWTIIDAHRRQVFAARFQRDAEGRFHCIVPIQILDADPWPAELQPGQHVSGPALTRLQASMPAGVMPVDKTHWCPTAAAVGQLGWQRYAAGQRDDIWALVPHYGRKSAAEEKRDSC